MYNFGNLEEREVLLKKNRNIIWKYKQVIINLIIFGIVILYSWIK